ncbi:MAG: hypothetical protein Q9222_007237, partial [Ikaeria aurantiellina]
TVSSQAQQEDIPIKEERPSIPRPPGPDATYQGVQYFLEAWFHHELGREEDSTRKLARQLPVNGQGLHNASEEALTNLYPGCVGELLFLDIRRSTPFYESLLLDWRDSAQ